jgi:hypothetical protein
MILPHECNSGKVKTGDGAGLGRVNRYQAVMARWEAARLESFPALGQSTGG